MKTAEFDFDLPEDRIALRPARPRDAARLLVVRPGDETEIEDRIVRDLPDLLSPGDVVVFNDTRVIPARLQARRVNTDGPGGRVELLLLRPIGDEGKDAGVCWTAFARPAKKCLPGTVLAVEGGQGLAVEVVARAEGGEVVLRFADESELRRALDRAGEMPLPPYIARRRPADARDIADYQTIYARRPGSVAAPTAGLHFTPALVAELAARGVRTARITLHVGAGTFLPVKTEDTADHRMHREYGEIDAATADLLNATRAGGGRIVAVGTTALRLLESAADTQGRLRPFADETALFILPGYRFRAVDVLMTNFHLPRSTLFMLVCAFAGTARMKRAYAHAVRAGYRFYSYGDATLLFRGAGGDE
ncbi:MAG: tRNA preQ1(34) S-adenosylmethionine ribosyltransferase-isomerase QueA [Alphaproteobacteria bacterium]|nr:MAG: tRNA preQ1(34) S-adenosylmethionine ribosyltransferase-isomerase QueA [Alphaproteobacteria bacterium]